MNNKLYSTIMAILFILVIGYLLLTSNWEVEVDKCFEYDTEEQVKICQEKNKKCDNDYCYIQKATKYLNTSTCTLISDEDLRIACVGEVRYYGTMADAVDNDDVTECDWLQNVQLKENCYNNFYMVKASLSADISFCEMITKEDLKNECKNI